MTGVFFLASWCREAPSQEDLFPGLKGTEEGQTVSLVPAAFQVNFGLGRSAGEGIGYPLQYSWASLVAQMVNNLPAIWETLVRSLGWEDLLEKGMATHFSILAWRIPMGRGTCWAIAHMVAESWTRLSN